MLLSEMFSTLQNSIETVRYLMSLFLVEFVGYETFAFLVVYWLVILFLPRFGYSRFKLHMVLFAEISLEIVFRKGYGYLVFGANKPPPEFGELHVIALFRSHVCTSVHVKHFVWRINVMMC